VKKVGKSGYYQPSTSHVGAVVSGCTGSVMYATSALKLEESARQANREATARATPGKGSMLGSIGAVSRQGKTSPSRGWEQVPDHASAGGGKMEKLARTPGNVATKSKGEFACGHNLEYVSMWKFLWLSVRGAINLTRRR
jgi:hypothetical protein